MSLKMVEKVKNNLSKGSHVDGRVSKEKDIAEIAANNLDCNKPCTSTGQNEEGNTEHTILYFLNSLENL